MQRVSLGESTYMVSALVRMLIWDRSKTACVPFRFFVGRFRNWAVQLLLRKWVHVCSFDLSSNLRLAVVSRGCNRNPVCCAVPDSPREPLK
jgi:hypothetical protein